MEPLLIIIVPGLLGGVLFALLFIRLGGGPDVTGDARLEPPSTGMINMARIRVSGFGGLGMLAMSITVAIFVPRIRLTMAIALLLGGAMAALLIALRRREGPLGSSGKHPGAHSMLPMDTQHAATSAERSAIDRGHELVIIPAKP